VVSEGPWLGLAGALEARPTCLAEYTQRGWALWCTPTIPALRRLRQEDHKFEGQPGLHTDNLPEKQTSWFTPVNLATWEAEIGGSQFKASPGKNFAKLYLNREGWGHDSGGRAPG
jgi:hypothetical protein